ncbi:hypothetical protein B0T18DRAFT_387526 [Schizothecium vesticola]|uniref:Uncharacterized protein n=1 Tax=Schizothecium vesticola TaxID=314040 RepID=A0AA40K9V3_9PEZI|nr:hypothetical protein B0T18DRAFT_387526 [Schizothecium vesticola]
MWSLRSILLLAASAHLIRAQQVTGITAGVNQQTGERPSRLDINELSSKGGPAWDLFVQALAAVENAPESDLIPPVTATPTLQVNGPGGPFNESKRAAGGAEDSDGVVRYDLIAERLGNNAPRIQREVYVALKQGPSFSNIASTSGRGISLKNLYNTVHQEIGGGPVSTALYPENATFTYSASGQALFGTAAGPVTPDSPLKPFVDGQGRFWTSKSAESTRAFGYTHPGLDDWAKSKDELKRQVTALVNSPYGPQTAQKRRRAARGAVHARQAGNATATEFAVQIQVDRADLASFLPCSIEVSVGDKVTGVHTLLSMPMAGVGGAKLPLTAGAKLPLTAGAGAGNGTAKGAPDADVVKGLVEKMTLVIRKGDSEGTVPVAKVPSLVVAIEGREVK